MEIFVKYIQNTKNTFKTKEYIFMYLLMNNSTSWPVLVFDLKYLLEEIWVAPWLLNSVVSINSSLLFSLLIIHAIVILKNIHVVSDYKTDNDVTVPTKDSYQ